MPKVKQNGLQVDGYGRQVETRYPDHVDGTVPAGEHATNGIHQRFDYDQLDRVRGENRCNCGDNRHVPLRYGWTLAFSRTDRTRVNVACWHDRRHGNTFTL